MDEVDEAIYTAMMYGKARRFDQILKLKPIPQLASLTEMTENDGNRHIFMIYSPVFVFFSESGLFLGLDAFFHEGFLGYYCRARG